MLTIRISEETEKELVQYCLDEGLTKSMVVKEALVAYLSQKRKTKSPYAAGEDLFGQEGSGTSDKSTSYKQRLKAKLHAKHSH
jgi:predicted transcriptional regulator